MATYVISDIHGCFDAFTGMLEKIGFSDTDELILAGDYVDRGKKCLEMLRWLESCPSNVFPVQGNHDAEYIRNILIMRRISQMENLVTGMDSNEETAAVYSATEECQQGWPVFGWRMKLRFICNGIRTGLYSFLRQIILK